MTPHQKRQIADYLALHQEQQRRQGQRLFYSLYPDADTVWHGPSILNGQIVPGQTLHARHKYPKHLAFFKAGFYSIERCFMAANRVGKTMAGGGFEMAAHLTGEYSDWWDGKTFDTEISAWAAGETYTTTRDILQQTLLGVIGKDGKPTGQGVIPGERLGAITMSRFVPQLVDRVEVRHNSGGWSDLQFKSYQEGRAKFQGTAKHVVWLDEEPPADVYAESILRTATLDGIIMLTFTPLRGMSEVVQSFLRAD